MSETFEYVIARNQKIKSVKKSANTIFSIHQGYFRPSRNGTIEEAQEVLKQVRSVSHKDFEIYKLVKVEC